MTIEQQADQVDRVKRSENRVIVNPFFLSRALSADADEIMARYKISGVPISKTGGWLGLSPTAICGLCPGRFCPADFRSHDQGEPCYGAGRDN